MATKAHVKIRPNHLPAWLVEVDGHDLSLSIPHDGLSVTFKDNIASVTLTLEDVDLDADLPESVLSALRAGDE